MEPVYQSIRERARQIADNTPVADFYRDFSVPETHSRNLFQSDPIIRKLRHQIIQQLKNNLGHGLNHAEKVAIDAGILLIAETETEGNPDSYIQRRLVCAQCAALLHDIERKQDDHAEKGAAAAREILIQYPFDSDEIKDICLAISNHEAFKPVIDLNSNAGKLLSNCLYDADKLRWGPDNFTDTLWRMVSFSEIPFEKFLKHYPKGMQSLQKIKATFRTNTGKQYGPQVIDQGILIGEELYAVILDEFSKSDRI